MYQNLTKKLKEKKISIQQLQKVLNLDTETVLCKIKGEKEWKIMECKKIISSLFPTCTIEYLFSKEEPTNEKI